MDPIKYIIEKPALTGRISRWQMLLSEYDIEYHNQRQGAGDQWYLHIYLSLIAFIFYFISECFISFYRILCFDCVFSGS